MSDDLERLRELHAHVCASDGDIGDDDGEQLECGATERDEHEAGVCAAWDALRDARNLGAREAFEEAARIAEEDWTKLHHAGPDIAAAIRERARRGR